MLPNLPETHLAIWGGETAGIAFALNSALEPGQMAELLKAANTKLLITLGPSSEFDIWERVAKSLLMLGGNVSALQGILAVNASHHEPGSKGCPGAGARQSALLESLYDIPVYDFHVEVDQEAGQHLNFKMPKAEDIASYFCTGGTTGLPKIAMHSHRNEISNALQLTFMIPSLYQPGKTLLACLPLFHVNAQLGSGLAAFASGNHALLGPPEGYRADQLLKRFWEVVACHAVASFSGVPTVFAGLMQSPMDGLDLSCLEYAICGAAPLPVELLNGFEAKTGMRMLEGYGLTESSCVASLNPPGAEPIVGSIGIRLP